MIVSIMDNLDRVFWPDEADNFDPSLYVHNMTNGLYKWRVKAEPFEYDIIDAGGSRPGRKKWHHCMTDSNFVFYVADLNAYCQTIEEEPDVVGHSLKNDAQPKAYPRMRRTNWRSL